MSFVYRYSTGKKTPGGAGTGIPVKSMNFAIARIIRVAQILVSKELHDVLLTNVDHLC